MSKPEPKNRQAACPDCDSDFAELNRRSFIKAAGAAALVSTLPNWAVAADTPAPTPETLVKKLYDSLSDAQKKEVAFDWDYQDPQRGLLRTRVSNNWNITKHDVISNYYTKDQQEMFRAIYEGLFQPDWVKKIDKQLADDAGGWGKKQSVAFFGKPGDGKFELVMTGRHLTCRCDGNSAEHMAFGGPIFHGHDPSKTFNEKPNHPDNIFWPQAVAANEVFTMLDGKQRQQALVARTPAESAVAFRGGSGGFPGIPVTELAKDQRAKLDETLKLMLSPYRAADADEVHECLKKQGGLEKCSLAFYQAGDVGDDGVWDNWRLEGPSFVWYFRGSPHVHLWINIGDDPSVKTNAQG